MTRQRRLLAAAAAAALGALVSGPALAQTPAAQPIGPDQYFAGEVNGNLGQSALSVQGCSPSAGSGASGQLLPGQTVEVTRFVVPPPGPGGHIVGYTGDAQSISADLEVSLPNPPLIYRVHIADLTAYNTKAPFPFMLSIPCDAAVTAVFSPINGGPTAMDSDVALGLESPAIVPSQTVVEPGQVITLDGTGFVPNTRYLIEECSKTSWIAPQDPCLDTNSITVATGMLGQFTHAFVPEACTAILPSTCYIGAPIPSGVDVVELAGAARITVR
jgi:hypothetical protein